MPRKAACPRSGSASKLGEKTMMLLEEDLRDRSFAKIEHLIRQPAPRTKGALAEAIGAALFATSAQDSRGFFEHAGYRPTGQLLCNVLNTGDKRG